MDNKKTPFSNKVGLINFAKCFFDLQKTVPQDRYVEKGTAYQYVVNQEHKADIQYVPNFISETCMKAYIDDPAILKRIKEL